MPSPSLKLLMVLFGSLLATLFLPQMLWAAPRAFLGTPVSVRFDNACTDKPTTDKIIFVFADDMKTGWIYGNDVDPAQLRQLPSGKYEVNYAFAVYNHLPSGLMELKPEKGGYSAIVVDHVVNDPELHKAACWYEMLMISLKPITGDTKRYEKRAKAGYEVGLLLQEGADLLYKKRDYVAAEANGRKALASLRPLFGRYCVETVDGASLLGWALWGQKRYDEAVRVIKPYRNALPHNPEIKRVYEQLRKQKKERDEIFKYHPDTEDEDETMG